MNNETLSGVPVGRLFLVFGRVPFADDDTVHVIEADDQGQAEAIFEAELLGEVLEDDPNDSHPRIYINQVCSLSDAIGARLTGTVLNGVASK
jgi:hypothetical protein